MSLKLVKSGKNIPHSINVIIEISSHSDPVKYEVDKESGAMLVDRFLSAPMHYPANYGYIPHTLSEDGDPVDVMVPTPFPVVPGSVIPCRPIGVLKMSDESGPDAKVIAVPEDALCYDYRGMTEYDELPTMLIEQITHFFTHYKDLEKTKWVKIERWEGSAEARKEVLESVERFLNVTDEPVN